METMSYEGLLIGASTLALIGLYHPLVVKAEYYYGQRSRWVFLTLGVIGVTSSLCVGDGVLSSLLGVLGCTSLWGIREVKEQSRRVEKGWFPSNPRRKREGKKGKNRKA
ncbi:MAG: DUF4491 family protein [Tannerellaceae bacterium]|nr:DUF4491 family protein [Tannerellaceae bacterium]